MIPRSRKLDRILESLSCLRGFLEIWAQDTRHPDRSPVCLVRCNNLLTNNFRTQVVHALAGDLSGEVLVEAPPGSPPGTPSTMEPPYPPGVSNRYITSVRFGVLETPAEVTDTEIEYKVVRGGIEYVYPRVTVPVTHEHIPRLDERGHVVGVLVRFESCLIPTSYWDMPFRTAGLIFANNTLATRVNFPPVQKNEGWTWWVFWDIRWPPEEEPEEE